MRILCRQNKPDMFVLKYRHKYRKNTVCLVLHKSGGPGSVERAERAAGVTLHKSAGPGSTER